MNNDSRPYSYQLSDWQEPGSIPSQFSQQSLNQGSIGQRALNNIFDLLLRRKWSILLCVAAVVSGTAVYTYLQDPEYEAHCIIMVELDAFRRPASGEESVNFEYYDLFSRNDRSLNAELFIIQVSKTIVLRVAERLLEMGKDPDYHASLDILKVKEGESLTAEKLANRLGGRVKFAPAGMDVSAIKVTAISSVPDEAALIANLYAEEYVRLTQEASRTRLSAMREFLANQEQRQLAELREIEGQIEAQLRNEGRVSVQQDANSMASQAALLEMRLEEARTELQVRQATLASIENNLRTLSPQVAERVSSGLEQHIQSVQTKMAEYVAQREVILLENPELRQEGASAEGLREINQNIQVLQTVLDSLSRKYVAETMSSGNVPGGQGALAYLESLRLKADQDRMEIGGLQIKIGILERRLQEFRSELVSAPGRTIEMARLDRSRTYAEQMHQFFVQQLQKIQLAEEAELGYAHVLREAGIPYMPSSPRVTRNLLLGVMAGLFVGIGLSVIREVLDRRYFKPDQLIQQGYPVIGTIPDMRPFIKKEFLRKPLVAIDSGEKSVSTSLIALLSPASAIAESYRDIRINIQFGLQDSAIQTLLVTSAGVGEGKSVSAANLAVVMAQSGRRTLLIDADLRRPHLHSLFNLPRAPGLLQVIVNAPEEIEQVVQAIDWMDNLHVITAGDAIANPSGLFNSENMKELVRFLKGRYDVIICDTPPLLAATDAKILATLCDASVIVARAGLTREDELQLAIEKLNEVGATVIGSIFNGFDLRKAYGNKFRYRHYYAYNQGSYYESNGM